MKVQNATIKGGSTVANRELRFKNKSNEVPGPGAYSVPLITESKLKFMETKVLSLKINLKKKI